MSDVSVGIGLTGIRIGLSADSFDSLRQRFNRRTLYGGPVMLIERRTGLALDATPEPGHETRPVLWTPHGLPWQQWRIVKRGPDLYSIISEMGHYALTTDHESKCGNHSWVWLERDRQRNAQQWRLQKLSDRTAFGIEAKSVNFSLDGTDCAQLPAAGEDLSIDSPTPPIMWETHGDLQQQWIIARLPLT